MSGDPCFWLRITRGVFSQLALSIWVGLTDFGFYVRVISMDHFSSKSLIPVYLSYLLD